MAAAATSRRALVAGGIGNVVEWYDFAVYGAFATVIAATYFPGDDPVGGLSASFAVFATAFLARPVGALVFGRLGDRVGRRPVLVTVILLMAAATAGIGLLPGRAAIGILAPVLLVGFRMLQGLSVGGEAAGATAFVVEYAPEGRRGWYGAWLWSTLGLGVAAGIGAAVVLTRLLPAAAVTDWGWRLAFLAAVPLGLVGLYLRVALDDTPRFRAVQRAGGVAPRPVADTLAGHGGGLLRGLVIVAAASLVFNLVFIYLPSYLAAALGVPLATTLPAALAGLLLGAAAGLAAGRLSDRVGRRPFLLAGTAGLLLVTLPAFLLIRGAGPAGRALGFVLVALSLSCLAVVPSHLAELFPTPVRSTALALTYGLGTALFGGTAPFLATWLVRRTGSPVAPAVYATLLAAAAVAAAVASRETAMQPLLADDRAEAELARHGP
jgi:MHS family proline/betaine transporter-like MFS transporter